MTVVYKLPDNTEPKDEYGKNCVKLGFSNGRNKNKYLLPIDKVNKLNGLLKLVSCL